MWKNKGNTDQHFLSILIKDITKFNKRQTQSNSILPNITQIIITIWNDTQL